MSTTILAACHSLVLGLALLYICLFTLTIPHRSLNYVRLLIAPQAIRYFWDFGYGSYEPPTLMISSVMAAIGWYGIMRVLEHTVVGLWDPIPPYWVGRAEKDRPCPTYPSPQSFRGRCFFAFDLLTSMRGSSWTQNREWNWIPRRFQSWTSAPPKEFIMDGIKTIFIEYLALDLCDTITKSRTWDTTSQSPIASLSVLEQSILVVCFCGGVFLSIDLYYTVLSTVSVLCGSSSDSWPPMVDSPFSSTSLSNFWARRWHWLFRRVFDRLSMPLLCVTMSIIRLGGKDVRQKEHVVSAIRTTVIFGLSTLLHLMVMHRIAKPEYRKNYGTDNPPFWDPDTLMFFMGQPVGLFLESTVIIRIANWMFPSKEYPGSKQASHPQTSVHSTSSPFDANQTGTTGALKLNGGSTVYRWERVVVTRLFAWVFLLWTGRWAVNIWVRVGFFHESQKVVPFSVWRGLWSGKWIV